MKKIFKFLLVMLASAAVVVACQKPAAPKSEEPGSETPGGEEPGGEEPGGDTVDPELVGTWSITGEAQEWKAEAGVAMTESNNVWTADEVAIKGEGFKFVKDGAWTVNLGAVASKATQKFDDGAEISLGKDGDNIAGQKDGIYKVTLNLLTKTATLKFVKDLEPEFVPAINIDGDFSDWADIADLTSTGTSRIRSWKFCSDAKNLYFYLVVRKNRMRTEYPVSIAFDVDESGSLSADNLSGAEFLAVFQPFTNPSSGTPTCVNGVISSAKINGEDATVSIMAYGVDPDASATGDSADYYLEVSIPRNTFTGFPAKGTEAKIGIGYEWYKTDYQAVTL